MLSSIILSFTLSIYAINEDFCPKLLRHLPPSILKLASKASNTSAEWEVHNIVKILNGIHGGLLNLELSEADRLVLRSQKRIYEAKLKQLAENAQREERPETGPSRQAPPGGTFRLVWVADSTSQLENIRNSSDPGLKKQIEKTIAQLQDGPTKYTSSLQSHRVKDQSEIWISYIQHKTPNAYRIFWTYGPENTIVILGISGHLDKSSDTRDYFKKLLQRIPPPPTAD